MSTSDPAEQLDALTEAFVARLRAGEDPSISTYAEQHPQHAEQIRKLFPMLKEMEGFKADLAMPDGPADTELGEYRLIREVGRGGMGVVYEARQETLDRRVALKVLPANLTRDPRFLERFRLEARLAGRMQHPNIVPVIGIGEHDGIHYFAMQYIEGRGLDALVEAVNARRRVGQEGVDPEPDPLLDRLLAAPLGEGSSTRTSVTGVPEPDMPSRPPTTVGRAWFDNAARLMLQATDGVAAAHARAILHRDIKPGNLLLDEQGKVWITDFGLCKEEGSSNLTQTGDVLGTLRYMPPERLKGESDVQGDVYGLGITLYELVTLRPAYPEDDHAQLLTRLSTEDLPRPRSANADIPGDLEAIVRKATARDRTQRYATAEALASDLRAFIERRPIAARPPSFGYHLRSAIRRHRALTATVVLALVAIVASTVFYVTSVKRKEADTRFQSYVATIAAADAALDGLDFSSARRLLDAAPAEYRGWEWRHIDSRFDRSLRTTQVSSGRVMSVAYSADGRWFAASAPDGVRIYDDVSAEERSRLDVRGSPGFVSWSPRGDHMAVAIQGRIEVWAWPERRRIQVLGNLAHGARFAWSGDGRRIATGGHDGILRVFELGATGPVLTLPARSIIKSIAAHPTEPWVATGTWDGHVTLWDVDSGARLWVRRIGDRGIHAIAFVGDAYLATTTESPHVHVWTVADGHLHRTLSQQGGAGTNGIAASPDGRTLVICTPTSITAYKTEAWQTLVHWPRAGRLRGVAIHPSAVRAATVGLDGSVREWGLTADSDPSQLTGLVDDVFDVAYAPSGAYLVSVGIGVPRCWDAKTGEQRRVWVGNRWTPTRVAISPDSRTVAVGDRAGDVVLWDVETDRIRHRLMGHGDDVRALAFAPDGARLYVAGQDGAKPLAGSLHVWDLQSAERLAKKEVGTARGTALALHPSGAQLATGDARGVIRIWDAGTLEVVRVIEAHADRVERIVFDAASSTLLSCSADGTLKVWRVEDGALVRRMHGGHMHALALSPDGARIASGGQDGTVRVWDSGTGQMVYQRGGLQAWVNGLAFSPDGSRLAVAESAHVLRVLDTRPLRDRLEGAAGLERRREADARVASMAATRTPEEVIEAVREAKDLSPEIREAMLRRAYRVHGTEAGLIDYLWRAVASRSLGLVDRLVARGVALDMNRAAGHRNHQDRRRTTLLGALHVRVGQFPQGVQWASRAMGFNEDRDPYLFAVDLAFLTLGNAGMGQRDAARGAFARLQAYLEAHPTLIDARLEQFRSEARQVVGALEK